MKKSIKVTLLIFILLLVDQVTKILVKTGMPLYDSIHICNWFQIYFTENPGMAFGLTIGSKSVLTILRLIVSSLILYYIVQLVRQNYKMSYIFCICLIFAGAIGNIFDSLFYGLLFSDSTPYSVAQFLPENGGYASLLHGRVVDMLYFPLFVFPKWVPFVGGDVFFSPIFNFADSCITVGVFVLAIFFRNEFSQTIDNIFGKKKKKTDLNE